MFLNEKENIFMTKIGKFIFNFWLKLGNNEDYQNKLYIL